MSNRIDLVRVTFRYISSFGKFSISLPVAMTAYTGYIIYDGRLSFKGILAALGIFLLSAAASALNQIQEKHYDALMKRTSNRPLPTGALTLRGGVLIMLLFLVSGTLFLIPFGAVSVFWGWMGVVWYNLVYTPLKRKTALAVFPGAFVGAIPPIVGWVASGGSIMDVRIHFLALFFFLGQIPHFFLLVLKYGDQYKNAGFPVITDVLSKNQVRRVNLVWFFATFISALFLPFFHVITNRVIIRIMVVSILLLTAWFIGITSRSRHNEQNLYFKRMFLYFNSFYLWMMLLMYADQI